MARKTNPALQALWRERVSRQLASRLSVAQFSRKERCAVSAFYAWRHRFRLANATDQRSILPTPSAFLPVTVRPLEHAPEERPPIEADLPNGIRLRIPTGNAWLACRLVRTIAGARTDSGGSR